tara:strand:- start:1832 stop:2005 length:174 start_codon:yes stop_codon:yes gene_type:complete
MASPQSDAMLTPFAFANHRFDLVLRRVDEVRKVLGRKVLVSRMTSRNNNLTVFCNVL